MPRPPALAAVIALVVATIGVPLAAQDHASAAPDAVPLEVTVTSDSAKGWIPSEQLVGQAVDAVERFFAALDGGDYPRAYALMTADNQTETPAARFGEEAGKFKQLAGSLLRRRIIASTWSKDPPSAPRPGIYAVFDLAAQYTNVDRQCGAILLHQPPAGGDFRVLRSENYFLDNRTAQQIELSQSHQELLDAWAKVSASCPKFSWDPTP